MSKLVGRLRPEDWGGAAAARSSPERRPNRGRGAPGGHRAAQAARLKRCGCFGPALPLFLPTKGHQGYRIVRPGSAVSKPDFRRLLQQVFAVFRRHPSLLALFNWHSCRRGGATHAYWTGTALDLLAPHGGWNSMEGLQVYISASFIQRLSVTQRM